MKLGTIGLLAGAAGLGGSGVAAACTNQSPSSSDIETAAFTSNADGFSPSTAVAEFFKLLQAEEAQEAASGTAPTTTSSTPTINPQVVAFLIAQHEHEMAMAQSSTNQSTPTQATDDRDDDDNGQVQTTSSSQSRSQGDDQGQGDDEAHHGHHHGDDGGGVSDH